MFKYLDELDASYDNHIITVVVSEFVLGRWWEQLLHNQSALVLKARLLFRPNTVVTSVPFHVAAPGVEGSASATFSERVAVAPDGSAPVARAPHRLEAQGRTRQRLPRG